ncbi:MAG: hypothetical protein JW937_09290 [Candidatus Omnitrophica bacterium]|nr:hypothetical protein [Candidatus Omnitrophota bacterium]
MALLPDLQFSVICDDVRREDNGKMMFLGLFEVIGAERFPATHPTLFVANRWCKGEGEFVQRTRLVNSKDNTTIVESPEVSFKLKDMDSHHTVISRFDRVTFPNPGKYWVEVLLADELMRNYPILLVEGKDPSKR